MTRYFISMDTPPLEKLAVNNLVKFPRNVQKPKTYYRGNKCAPERELPSFQNLL